jgi:hypothetical protein
VKNNYDIPQGPTVQLSIYIIGKQLQHNLNTILTHNGVGLTCVGSTPFWVDCVQRELIVALQECTTSALSPSHEGRAQTCGLHPIVSEDCVQRELIVALQECICYALIVKWSFLVFKLYKGVAHLAFPRKPWRFWS